MMNKNIVKMIHLPVINDDCSLAVAEGSILPFVIKRLYYIYNAKNKEPRGFHAHKQTQQVLFCLNGTVRIVLESASGRGECKLTDPSQGVMLDKMVWHEMHDMDADTILLVLASHEYDESDYLRNYDDFKSLL